MSYIGDGDLGKYMGDLVTCWYVFVIMIGVTLVMGIIYIILMRCIAKPLLYISFVLIFCLLVGGGFYVFFLYKLYELNDHTREVM
jgi:hypothetical protein